MDDIIVLVLSVFYVISLIILIGAMISTFIHRNNKEYTEIDIFINSNDEYWFG